MRRRRRRREVDEMWKAMDSHVHLIESRLISSMLRIVPYDMTFRFLVWSLSCRDVHTYSTLLYSSSV